MNTYIFIILHFLAFSQLTNCGPLHLNSAYHSVYSYEVLLSSIEDGTPKKQISISSQFELHPTSKLTYDITFKNVESKEIGNSLDEGLIEQLKQKFSVTIIRLPVSEFTDVSIKFSDPKESIEVKNIKRGLVALLSVDYRNEATYKATQSGLLGRCENEYSISRTPKLDGQSSIYVTRTRVKDTCKASKEIQTIESDKIWQEIKSESKSDYYYEMIETDEEVYIKHADLEERLSLQYKRLSRNLTFPLISQQKVKLLSREKHGSDHRLRKRQLRYPRLQIPTVETLHLPTMPSITSIVNRSREAIDNAVHKVIDGATTTTLEADTYNKPDPGSITDVAEKFNKLTETLSAVETKDVEKLQLGYQYAELSNYLLFADKEYLINLFKSDKINAEPRMRRRVFFQLLSLLSQHSAFQAAKEVFNNDLNAEDKVKQFAIGTMAVYFTSRTRKSFMTNEEANEVYEFCKESLVQNHENLYKACYLYFSRMVSMNYLSGSLSSKQVDNFQKRVMSDLLSNVNKIEDNESPVKLLLAVKSMKNFFGTTAGLDFMKKILEKRTHKHLLRAEAAWGLMNFEVGPIKDNLMNLLYDQTESTEIRLAIFFSLIAKHGKDLIPFVTRMKLNFLKGTYVDDKQLVIKINTLLRHLIEMSGNEERQRNAQMLYDFIKEDYKEYLGYLSDSFYHKSYLNGEIQYLLFTTDSKDSLIPEAFYLSSGDSFDTSQYVLRSQHGNILSEFLPRMDSGETANADIQDAILKIIQQLHLTLKYRDEHNYTISRMQNNYEVYFIYGDDNHNLYSMDLIAFKGNGVHLKYSLFTFSFTESGLPYYMDSKQLSITRLLPANDGINVFRATGGYSHSVIFPIICKLYLVSGKFVEETLRTNIHLGFMAENPYPEFVHLNGSFSLLNDGETLTSIYYKSQRLINIVTDDYYLSLHLNKMDQFDAKNYDEVVNNYGDFRVRSRFPIGRADENVFHVENLAKGFKTIGSLVCRKKYNYDVKVTFEPNPPHSALVWNLDFLREPNAKSVKLILSHDTQKLYSIWIRRTHYTKDREIKFEVVTKDFPNSYTTYFKASVQFPHQTFTKLISSEILPNIQNATITGGFYTGSDLLGELGKKPEDLYLSFKGTFSKRHDNREIKTYDRFQRFCIIRSDVKCAMKFYKTAHKYNRLELDIDIARTFAPGEYTVLDNMSMSMFENYKSHIVMNSSKKTNSLNKARIEIDLLRDLKRYPTADISFRRFWGEATYRSIPVRITHLFFGYSAFEENLVLSNKFPFYDPPTCLVNTTEFQTFDGNKQQSKSCNKPQMIAGDCSKFKFFVIRNKDSVTVLYDHRHNVTLTDVAYVNGKQEDIPDNHVFEYTDFRIVRNIYGGTVGQRVEFGLSLVVIRYQNGIIVIANPLYKNRLCGVCGNSDGDWSNDIVSPKHEPIKGDRVYESWSFGEDGQCN